LINSSNIINELKELISIVEKDPQPSISELAKELEKNLF